MKATELPYRYRKKKKTLSYTGDCQKSLIFTSFIFHKHQCDKHYGDNILFTGKIKESRRQLGKVPTAHTVPPPPPSLLRLGREVSEDCHVHNPPPPYCVRSVPAQSAQYSELFCLCRVPRCRWENKTPGGPVDPRPAVLQSVRPSTSSTVSKRCNPSIPTPPSPPLCQLCPKSAKPLAAVKASGCRGKKYCWGSRKPPLLWGGWWSCSWAWWEGCCCKPPDRGAAGGDV